MNSSILTVGCYEVDYTNEFVQKVSPEDETDTDAYALCRDTGYTFASRFSRTICCSNEFSVENCVIDSVMMKHHVGVFTEL